MDVSSVVNDSAFVAGCFALLAYIALSVELGPRPLRSHAIAEKSDQSKGPNQTGSRTQRQDRRGIRATGESRSVDRAREEADDLAHLRRSGENQSFQPQDKEKEISDSLMAMLELQNACVDGFIGPRTKYDVALAMLSEVQAMPDKDAAEEMAVEAYQIARAHPRFGKFIIRSTRKPRPVGKRESFSEKFSSPPSSNRDEWRS